MMKKNYTVSIVCALFFLHSCKKYDANGNEIIFEELYKAHWVLGDWQMEDSLGVLTESWTQIDDSTCNGSTYYIKNKKDTIHFETMELMQNEDLLIYTSTVKGENGNQAVSYRLIEDNDSLLVFENKKHDYPQKIAYSKENDTTIKAVIQGIQNKKQKTDSYLFKKLLQKEK